MHKMLRSAAGLAVVLLAAGCGGKPPVADLLPFDQAPRVVKKVAHEYPAEAEREGIAETVILRVTVGEDGRVSKVEIYDSRHKALAKAAVAAARQWEFEPATKNGEPAEATILIPFEFAPGGG